MWCQFTQPVAVDHWTIVEFTEIANDENLTLRQIYIILMIARFRCFLVWKFLFSLNEEADNWFLKAKERIIV